jgi:hypothetical protein
MFGLILKNWRKERDILSVPLARSQNRMSESNVGEPRILSVGLMQAISRSHTKS